MIVLIKIWPEGDYQPLPMATYMHKLTKIVYVETDLWEAYSNWSQLWSVLSWQKFCSIPHEV